MQSSAHAARIRIMLIIRGVYYILTTVSTLTRKSWTVSLEALIVFLVILALFVLAR